MKRIAVQENLTDIKEALKKRGYEVVGYNERGYIDAIVYLDDYEGIHNLNNENTGNHNGAIMINVKNKSIEDIVYIIEHRRYEGLFS